MNIIFDIFNNLLSYFQGITGDWGIAIVLLTVLVKSILLPMSIKQKISIQEQQNLKVKEEEIRKRYKKNKVKLEKELQNHYMKASKSMLGCFASFLQLPVIFTLYRVVMKLPIEAATILIPWVSSIKMVDSYFVIPIVYTLLMLSPSLISQIKCFNKAASGVSKSNIIMTSIFSMMITIKAPIALGLYFIISGAFTVMEEVIFRVFFKNRIANIA